MSKIGRNEPCPCGSGEKYKRCHGAGAPAQSPVIDEATQNLARKTLMRNQAHQNDSETQFAELSALVSGASSVDGLYITSFRWLNVSEPVRGHFQLLPGVHITNDPVVKAELLTAEFATYAGLIELSHLQDARNIVFGQFSKADMHGLPPDRFLLVILMWIQGLFDTAWLVKDHSMRCEGAYLKSPSGGTHRNWSSNFLMVGARSANGELNEIDMSLDELRVWSEKQEQVGSYLAETNSINVVRFMMEKGFTRSGLRSAVRRPSSFRSRSSV